MSGPVTTFVDVGDCAGYLAPRRFITEHMANKQGSGPDWTFGPLGKRRSFEQARVALLEQLRSGIPRPEVRAAYEAQRDGIAAALQSQFRREVQSFRRRAVRREEGDEVDADRWAAGAPDHWRRMERQARPGAGRALRLGIEYGVAGFCDTDYWTQLGATVGALVDTLRAARVAVQVVGTRTSEAKLGPEDGRARYGVRWVFCSARERWDVDRFLAWAEAGTFRYLGFSHLHSRWPKAFHYGAGNRFEPDLSTAQAAGVDVLIWHGDLDRITPAIAAHQLGQRVATALGMEPASAA